MCAGMQWLQSSPLPHNPVPPQENRLTQARIDEALGADLLGRVVFYGQSDITALLEVRPMLLCLNSHWIHEPCHNSTEW